MTELNCTDCPASLLKTTTQLQRISDWYEIKKRELKEIKEPKVILLCESYPEKRYIYDLSTSYNNRGLRINLKKELYRSDILDEDFLINLRRDKILIHDCAFCPIFLVGPLYNKKLATTVCLVRHNLNILHKFKNVPIISLFPVGRGFIPNIVPDIAERIIPGFSFENLKGLKNMIQKLGYNA